MLIISIFREWYPGSLGLKVGFPSIHPHLRKGKWHDKTLIKLPG
jgi:hypothetical protein